jgi:heme exporter protein D
MSHWPFVIAAYAFTLAATFALLVQSFVSMRKAEAQADRLRAPE